MDGWQLFAIYLSIYFKLKSPNKIYSAAAEISAEVIGIIYVGQAWFHLWECYFSSFQDFKISTEISATCVQD